MIDQVETRPEIFHCVARNAHIRRRENIRGKTLTLRCQVGDLVAAQHYGMGQLS